MVGEGGEVIVHGGTFTGGSGTRGAFLYAEDDTRVRIVGGLFKANIASRGGGAVSEAAAIEPEQIS